MRKLAFIKVVWKCGKCGEVMNDSTFEVQTFHIKGYQGRFILARCDECGDKEFIGIDTSENIPYDEATGIVKSNAIAYLS